MNTMKICSGCQKPLEANAPDGLCPECLLKAGLGTGVDLGPDGQRESEPRQWFSARFQIRRGIWWLTAGGSIAVIVGCLLHTLPRWTEERRVDSLRRASFPIRSVDPVDDDFGDLMPLIDIIGSRRFVFMGETTHEDRGTFDAETRLIRFLHQKMGFDVISIEWSYAGIDSLYEALKARGRNGEPFRQPLLPRYLEAHRPLLDYVCATHAKGDRPISLMGHHVYYFADTDLPQRMDSFLGSAKPEPLNHLQNERFQILLKRITSGS